MRNRDADERDRSGKRRYTRREHARQQDQHHAERGNIDAHTAGIPLSELVRADRLGQQEHANERHQHHRRHHADIVPGNARKAAHRPVMQVDNIGILSKGNDEIRHRRADIANHHAAHNQQRHLPHALRDEQHKAHREHGSRKGGCYHDGRAEHAPAGQCAYHRQRDRQLSPRGNAQHERPRDRVGEKSLQQKAGDRQRTAEQDGREDTRQANLPHDDRIVAAVRQQNLRDLSDGQVQAARVDIPHEQHGQQCQKHGKRARITHFRLRFHGKSSPFRTVCVSISGWTGHRLQ